MLPLYLASRMPDAGISARPPPTGAELGPLRHRRDVSSGQARVENTNPRVDFQIQAFYRNLSANFTIIIQILLSQKLNRFLEISKRPVINILAEYVDNYRVICILYLLNLLLAAPVHTSLPSRRDETNLLGCAFQ